jgi:hypothetical protein
MSAARQYYGSLYADGSSVANTTVTTPEVYIGWSGIYPEGQQGGCTPVMNTSDATKYEAIECHFTCLAKVSFTVKITDGAAGDATAILYKNGVAVPGTEATGSAAANSDLVTLSGSALVEVNDGDKFSLYLGSSTSATLLLSDGSLIVEGIGPVPVDY